MAGKSYVHPTASVSPKAAVGAGTKIWQGAQVREKAVIGEGCILGYGVYVDAGVKVGDNCKIQNGVNLYQGVSLEDGVFCGPGCVFTNDKLPRAIHQDGSLQTAGDWEVVPTLVRRGASIGANATILCGVTIGRWAMIGAGAVVTQDVPDHGMVVGNPGRITGYVCSCGEKLMTAKPDAPWGDHTCGRCGVTIEISRSSAVSPENDEA